MWISKDVHSHSIQFNHPNAMVSCMSVQPASRFVTPGLPEQSEAMVENELVVYAAEPTQRILRKP